MRFVLLQFWDTCIPDTLVDLHQGDVPAWCLHTVQPCWSGERRKMNSKDKLQTNFQDIINIYKNQQGVKSVKREELETPSYTTSIPSTLAAWNLQGIKEGEGVKGRGVWIYQNMWHYASLVIQNTNLICSRNQIFWPGVSWSISVLPDCGLNVTICHENWNSILSMCFDSFIVFLIVQLWF